MRESELYVVQMNHVELGERLLEEFPRVFGKGRVILALHPELGLYQLSQRFLGDLGYNTIQEVWEYVFAVTSIGERMDLEDRLARGVSVRRGSDIRSPRQKLSDFITRKTYRANLEVNEGRIGVWETVDSNVLPEPIKQRILGLIESEEATADV